MMAAIDCMVWKVPLWSGLSSSSNTGHCRGEHATREMEGERGRGEGEGGRVKGEGEGGRGRGEGE